MDLTLMEYDAEMRMWLPLFGIKDYPIEPQAGDCFSVPEKGQPFPEKPYDGMVLRSVEVVRRVLPTPNFNKVLTLYVKEV